MHKLVEPNFLGLIHAEICNISNMYTRIDDKSFMQMSLMLGDIPHLLDLVYYWISPSEDDGNIFR